MLHSNNKIIFANIYKFIDEFVIDLRILFEIAFY